ncbi:hypothetical protein Tco_1473939 [Tanacetum coccineum]
MMKEEKTEISERRIEDVPVVRDFPEVFPKDLSGLPQTRQVEFHIELIPGAALLHAPQYRLAPTGDERLLKKEELAMKFREGTTPLYDLELGDLVVSRPEDLEITFAIGTKFVIIMGKAIVIATMLCVERKEVETVAELVGLVMTIGLDTSFTNLLEVVSKEGGLRLYNIEVKDIEGLLIN